MRRHELVERNNARNIVKEFKYSGETIQILKDGDGYTWHVKGSSDDFGSGEGPIIAKTSAEAEKHVKQTLDSWAE